MIVAGSPPLEIPRVSRAIALAVTVLLLCFGACSREPPEELPAAPTEGAEATADSLLDADPEETLPVDPELEEFLWRAQFLLRRISARRPTREETRRALRRGPAGLADLAGISPAELSARMDTLRWQGAVLLQRYPELAACLEEIEYEEGPPCDPSDALGLMQELSSLAQRRIGSKTDRAGPVMEDGDRTKATRHVRASLRREDLPYVASLILSAATDNPILFFVGMALAMRSCGGTQSVGITPGPGMLFKPP